MSVWPFSTAPTDTATSGALVPKATTVSPTTSGEMPIDSASFDAPRTSRLAPNTSKARPPRKSRMFILSPPTLARSAATVAAASRSPGARGFGAAQSSSARPSTLRIVASDVDISLSV